MEDTLISEIQGVRKRHTAIDIQSPCDSVNQVQRLGSKYNSKRNENIGWKTFRLVRNHPKTSLFAIYCFIAYIHFPDDRKENLEQENFFKTAENYRAEAVQRLMHSLNESLDPCEDFYLYSCQGWIQNRSLELKATRDKTYCQAYGDTNKQNYKLALKLIGKLSNAGAEEKANNYFASCVAHDHPLWSSSSYKQNSTEIEAGETISRSLERFLFKFLKWAFPGIKDFFSQWCAELTISRFPEVIATLFVRYTQNNVLDMESKKGLDDLIRQIRPTFQHMIMTDLYWMDQESRLKIFGNISKIEIRFGHIFGLMTSTYADDVYQSLRISSKDFPQNGSKLMDFFKGTLDVNGYYMESLNMESLNTIYMPPGAVHAPFYHHSYPSFLKFAKMGWLLSHEVAHSLYPIIQDILNTNASNPQSNPVSDVTKISFGEQMDCVRDQYNSYELPLSSAIKNAKLSVNGSHTLVENLADIIAIQLAFKSFLHRTEALRQPIPVEWSKFTKEQLFFIANAQDHCEAYKNSEVEMARLTEQVKSDPHSPESVRVLGMLSNFDEFAKAFNCPVGSRYNPEKKCRLFS